MERAQATVEYVALVAVALIAACLLVRYATPARQVARDIVATLISHRGRPVQRPAHHPHLGGYHIVRPPCGCPAGIFARH